MTKSFNFDRYYCINFAQTKEIIMYYVLQPRHIFIHVKVFISMLVLGGLQFLIISLCFAWRPVTNINKIHVLTACVQVNSNLNGCKYCVTHIYAIICNKMAYFKYLCFRSTQIEMISAREVMNYPKLLVILVADWHVV